MAQGSGDQRAVGIADPEESSPNMIVYRKIEDIITKMQDDKTGGVPIRTVKSFLSKIPSVVTGTDIVQWLMKNLSIEDPVEAIHLGSLIAAQGYIFPISDHVLTMKDDGTFYRFQAPYFWPSNCWEPENTDYAIYLCKRTMQNKARLELADYEAENLARLQRAFARKWEFIFMQAEAQVKIDRKKDKTERKILDSQERAFWDVHRPVPGCVNTTEMDIRKCRRLKNPQKVKKSVYGVTEESQSQSPVHIPSQPIRKTTKEDIRKQITFLNAQIDRHCLKMSKVAESKEPSQQRVKRWGFSFDEVLKDQVGRDQFRRFLESEFSSENLRFWLAVQDLKKQPLQDVAKRVEEIWQEFLAPGAPSAINLDSHSYEITSQNVKDGGRYTFEDAQEHIYKLMKSDSYARFLRSNAYQDLLLAKKKPESEQGRRTSLEKFTRSVVSSAGFLPSTFLLVFLCFFNFLLSVVVSFGGGRESRAFRTRYTLFLLRASAASLLGMGLQTPSSSPVHTQPPSLGPGVRSSVRGFEEEGPCCPWGCTACVSSAAAQGEGHRTAP
ncbi:regulator of G-protein signaling 6 isoform X3 [Ursus arctos]|uniref:regulator of G-protein signaling 6 isoform X3 n=1 Tax=Ursus arctos TaxID=9644 RepID=UPI0020179497|nr:regulator of G-protein signaling 6 isoform X3 [Ursus arctos]XP_048076033.1 regulator of G-protein signaling 6 isoform X3 [Ursus arctos]XP_048076034.1 regulator of G-protein signaling 6 isoform X3 [Ursus arctos]